MSTYLPSSDGGGEQCLTPPAYSNTLHYLLLHPPASVVVTDTQVASSQSASAFARKERPQLIERIEDEYDVRCETVARVHWNAEAGTRLNARRGFMSHDVCGAND